MIGSARSALIGSARCASIRSARSAVVRCRAVRLGRVPPSRAVLITGCSSGIGHATAERLLAGGWKVYATARRPDSIADLADKGAITLALDVTDESSMAAAVQAVTEAEGAVGVLVNNAGYSQSGAVESVPIDQVRRQFETNVFGLIRMCQLVLPGMREQGWGKIVNVGSMGGRLTFPGGGVYHATKYAVEALSDALRFEVRGFGVDVILIEPGLIVTGFGEVAVGARWPTRPGTAPTTIQPPGGQGHRRGLQAVRWSSSAADPRRSPRRSPARWRRSGPRPATRSPPART